MPAYVLATETYRNPETGTCLDGNGSGDMYLFLCNGGPSSAADGRRYPRTSGVGSSAATPVAAERR
jgi:hypothetical protein